MRCWWVVLALGACGGDKPADDGAADGGDADTDSDTDSDADADADSDADTDTGPQGDVCPQADFAGTPRTASGDTTGLADDWTGSCGGPGVGADSTARFVAGDAGRYVVHDEGTSFDAVLYVTDGCGGAELGCSDAVGAGNDFVVLDLLAGQEVIAVVDGAAGRAGPFTLTAERVPPRETSCDDGRDDDWDGDTDCDDADCAGDRDCEPVQTADTGRGGLYFEPEAIQVYASFGYDAALGALVDVTTPYGVVTSALSLYVGNDQWVASGLDPSRTDLYCTIEYPLTDPTFAAWAAALPTAWYGVEYTGAVTSTSCTAANGFDVDPAFLGGYADLATVFSSVGTWGVAVGDVSANAAAALAGYPYVNIPAGSFAGGFVLDPLLGTEVDSVLSLASEIDATYTLTGNYVPAASVPASPVVTAYYDVISLYYVYFN